MRLFTILLLLLTLAACGDEEVVGPDPPLDLPLVSAGDAGRDFAIAELAGSFEDLNLEDYDQLLHPDFVFVYPAGAMRRIEFAELSRAEDFAGVERIFSGQEGAKPILDEFGNPTGQFERVPPVASITMQFAAAPGSSWAYQADGDYAGTWSRAYEVTAQVDFSGPGEAEPLVGQQTFRLAPGTRIVDGQEVEVWQIRVWSDAELPPMDGSTMSIAELKGFYLS